jgi:hypothetical protein
VPITVSGAEEPIRAKHGEVTPGIVFVKIHKEDLGSESLPLTFTVTATLPTGTEIEASRASAFFGPKR